MTELEMTTEAEDFTDEMSDEAIDQAEGAYCAPCSWADSCRR